MTINEIMKVKCYNSVKQVDSLWDEYIGKRSICISSNFMFTLECLYPNDLFYYYTVYRNDEEIGLFFLYSKIHYLFEDYYIGKICPNIFSLKILMTGTFETYGKHYWFNPNYFSEVEFINLIYKHAFKLKFSVFIFRDFLGSVSPEIENNFKLSQFKKINLLGVSTIEIDQNVFLDFDNYLYSLKKKHRNTYKKILKSAVEKEWCINESTDFQSHIEDIYQLYLETNNRAKEYNTRPLPIDFLKMFNDNMPNNTSCILIRDKNKIIIGFVLLFESKYEVVPFLMGTKKLPGIWHIITLNTIKYAINKNKKVIDLGITNSAMKKRLGARVTNLTAYARFKKSIINLILGSILEKILT